MSFDPNKLVTVAENVPKIYKAGYEKGKSEGGGGLPDNMEYLNHLVSLKITDWSWAQGKEEIEIYSPTATSIDLEGSTDKGDTIKHITITCDTPLKTMAGMFATGKWAFWGLERITINADTSQATGWHKVCDFIQYLRVIDGSPLNFKSRYGTTYTPFYICPNLEEFRVVPNSIYLPLDFGTNGKLSDATIDSVAEGLVDLTGGTAQTLSFHADVKARIEADDAKEDTDPTKRRWLSTITGKNWTIT